MNKEYHKRYREEHKKERYEYNKKYRALHKAKCDAWHKNWVNNNKDKVKISSKRYNDKHKNSIIAWQLSNSEHVKQYKREWYLKNKEYMEAYHKKYRADNKDKYNELCIKRHRNIIVLERISRARLREMYDNKCVFCGQGLGDKFHADHLLPVSRYEKIGKKCLHDYNNVAPTCPTCNLSKHDKTPLEFMWNKEVAYVYQSR